MENWLYLIRIIFILVIFLFIQSIINTVQKDIDTQDAPSEKEEEEIHRKTKFRLEVLKGADRIKLIKDNIDILEQLNFGRDINNDIVADDKYISASHFRIKKLSEEYFIEDSGSTNGTSLNNKQITGLIKLKDNDIINLGEIQFKVHIYYDKN